uniref:Terpene cyclase/mutase family member n=1 Tax=Chromera velia CCMP2878 TaxID=1169474 RepID=A0A0G4HPQ4_9ALVE|eukprot:Cvel_7823.t1-p1 / transcript=Cvel_7823.t1 / gene=Cvel_7823 / organism=Chromera_velia_CCMP2878 / gene_product=Cycloartenol synthase, putative / transcript_product=Cycloartenol synthase, putative / location=Cvel_scaffold417:83703-86423(+) / protein_length=907 / sequence_SO=supercontig / SO=protein_coding / is_pseudo=false
MSAPPSKRKSRCPWIAELAQFDNPLPVDLEASRAITSRFKFLSDVSSKNFSLKNPAQNPAGVGIVGSVIGRQVWVVSDEPQKTGTFDPSVNPNPADIPLRSGLMAYNLVKKRALLEQSRQLAEKDGSSGGSPRVLPERVSASFSKATEYLALTQCDDGHWAGDYGGPHFLLPGLVITCHLIQHDVGDVWKEAMRRYLINHQQKDGGWGIHIEGRSGVFCSCLSYVALRLLGVPPSSPVCVRARGFIRRGGGPARCPQWGKVWMALAGVFDWRGVPPVPVELWALPTWFPFHPAHMWCHARLVYLPMSYLSAQRVRGPETPLIASIRRELFSPSEEMMGDERRMEGVLQRVNWTSVRFSRSSSKDVFRPIGLASLALYVCAHVYELLGNGPFGIFGWLKKRGIGFALEYMREEDEGTNFLCIGPVNKLLNMCCHWHASGCNPNDPHVLKHIPRLYDYMWVSEDGAKMQGQVGSQVWDASFAVQALLQSPKSLTPLAEDSLSGAVSFLVQSRFEGPPSVGRRFSETPFAGGWPFTVRAAHWQVSDCTAEAFAAMLALRARGARKVDSGSSQTLSLPELRESASLLVSMQNRNGGWAAYQKKRAGAWYELLNPSEVFGDIMLDYPHVECSGSVTHSLVAYLNAEPEGPRHAPVVDAVLRGVHFILSHQKPDGSWHGSWGVCFTYAAFLACRALVASCLSGPVSHTVSRGGKAKGKVGVMRQRIIKAVMGCADFLLRKQRSDGGWQEAFKSCATLQWEETPQPCPSPEGSVRNGLSEKPVSEISWTIAEGGDGDGLGQSLEDGPERLGCTDCVQTAWAVLALLEVLSLYQEESAGMGARGGSGKAWEEIELVQRGARRGIEFLVSAQKGDGDWRQNGCAGVFNNTVGISYANYRNIFPTWALAKFLDLGLQ